MESLLLLAFVCAHKHGLNYSSSLPEWLIDRLLGEMADFDDMEFQRMAEECDYADMGVCLDWHHDDDEYCDVCF